MASALLIRGRMSDASRIRVFLVDDDEIIRLGLRACLHSDVSVSIIGEAAAAAQAVVQAVRLTPNVVVMEARLPDGSGIEACRQIRAQAPSVQVVIISEAVDVVPAVQAGAAGFVSKRTRAADIVRAVRGAA